MIPLNRFRARPPIFGGIFLAQLPPTPGGIFFGQLPPLPYYAIMTVVLDVIRFSEGVFSGVFLFEVGLSTPPAANGDLWRLPPVKIFYFYFFKNFLYQNQLVGVNGLLGTLVLGGCYN